MSNLVVKDGKLEIIIPPGETAKEDPVADLASSGILDKVSHTEILGVPLGSGILAGTYADLISALITRYVPANIMGTAGPLVGKLIAAWSTAFIGNRVKFIGRGLGRDGALLIVADAARPYTAPLIAQILAMIPAPAAMAQQAGLMQANQVLSSYQAGNPYSPYGGK